MKHAVAIESTSSLDLALQQWAGRRADRNAVASTISTIADTAIEIEALIAQGALAAGIVEVGYGDRQDALDVRSEKRFAAALSDAPVAAIGSAVQDSASLLSLDAPFAVAIDPLNGASDVDTNIPVGTIFSILPVSGDPASAVLQPGHRQLAAGFVAYGPQTSLVLTLGEGTDIYTFDRDELCFRRTHRNIRLAPLSTDYAIDASNYRHWYAPVRAYVDDNVAGVDGPRGKNFTMRWTASLVAETYRILLRGGICLYPGDKREDHEKGSLRLVYQANPLAMIVEQAGGLATDGEARILDIRPKALHERTPLIFGSRTKVERVRAFHDGTLTLGERSPLFGRRGLFRH